MADETKNDAMDVTSEEGRRIKVTVVGDSCVGKTCLLMAFANNKFPEPDENICGQSLFENSKGTKGTLRAKSEGSFEVPVDMETDNGNVELGLTDTIGTENYRPLREVFGANTDVFIVCFSVTDPDSLENVQKNWLTEIKILTPGAPFILVGTKTDLRENEEIVGALKTQGKEPFSLLQGIKMAKKFGAKEYVECSSLNMVSVKSVFKAVVLVKYQDETKGKCSGKKKSPVVNSCVLS